MTCSKSKQACCHCRGNIVKGGLYFAQSMCSFFMRANQIINSYAYVLRRPLQQIEKKSKASSLKRRKTKPWGDLPQTPASVRRLTRECREKQLKLYMACMPVFL